MKRLILLIGISLVGGMLLAFVSPKKAEAVAPECYTQTKTTGATDGQIRKSPCGNWFKNLANEQLGGNRNQNTPLRQDQCYMISTTRGRATIQEQGRNSEKCRAWRFFGVGSADTGGRGSDGLQNPFGEAPPEGPGKVCGDDDRKVTVSINIGCRGEGNPLIDLLFALTRFLSIGVGIVGVASIVVGGIQYTTSAGNPENTAKAVQRISNTAIALLIYFLIFAILSWLVPGGLF